MYFIFSINTNLQQQNLDVIQNQNSISNNFTRLQSNYNKLQTNLSKIHSRPKIDSIKRDEINEIYEFTYTFDGTVGEEALTFRENIKNHVKYVKDKVGAQYTESRILNRIIKSLNHNAAAKYNNRQGKRFDTLNEFYTWFDKEFRLHTLRTDLFKELTNWNIPSGTFIVDIVDAYTKKIKFIQIDGSSIQQGITKCNIFACRDHGNHDNQSN